MCKNCAQDAVLTDYANSLIRFKARQLSRRAGFSRSDQEDLEQDLWAALFSRAEAFDPDRASLDTFIDRVVNSAVRMILRDRRRQKRASGFYTRSLDDRMQGGDASSASPGCELDEHDRARHRGNCPTDEAAQRDDREATEYALRQMPDPVSEVCRRVMGGSVSSAARELGRSRRQIRNALAEARLYFERAGFGGDV